MKTLDRYIVGSLLRYTFWAVALLVLVLTLFDLFSHLDSYVSRHVAWSTIVRLSLFYIPQAVVYAIAPAALFAATYFLSLLNANNELIVLYTAGIPYYRIAAPILFLGLLFSFAQGACNEAIAIPLTVERTTLANAALGIQKSSDASNVILQDAQGTYVLYAARYYEQQQRISSPLVVFFDDQGQLTERIDASSGWYNGEYWVLEDTTLYTIDTDGMAVSVERQAEYHDTRISLEPALFRNLSSDIRTMELNSALRYVRQLKTINYGHYREYATDLADRIYANLNPFILVCISCSVVFRWKKNVLVLSILSSLSVAVVYYVMRMVSLIFAKQGVIAPSLAALAPMAILMVLAALWLLGKKRMY